MTVYHINRRWGQYFLIPKKKEKNVRVCGSFFLFLLVFWSQRLIFYQVLNLFWMSHFGCMWVTVLLLSDRKWKLLQHKDLSCSNFKLDSALLLLFPPFLWRLLTYETGAAKNVFYKGCFEATSEELLWGAQPLHLWKGWANDKNYKGLLLIYSCRNKEEAGWYQVLSWVFQSQAWD